MPLCAKSAKITFMPVAERLVELGHKESIFITLIRSKFRAKSPEKWV
jgi:hypothetical protein